MDKAAAIPAPCLTLVRHPTESQIHRLWQARLRNPEESQYAFADVSPTLGQFISALAKGEILCLMVQNDQDDLMAASWLHDLVRDRQGQVKMGWTGLYTFPQYRGKPGIEASHMMMDDFYQRGVQHIHAAVHIDNKKALAFTRSKSMLSFTFVGHYANWASFGGRLSDAAIFTRHAGDKRQAWLSAQELAAKRGSCPRVILSP